MDSIGLKRSSGLVLCGKFLREYWERKRFRNAPGSFMICRKVFRALKGFKKAKKGPQEF